MFVPQAPAGWPRRPGGWPGRSPSSRAGCASSTRAGGAASSRRTWCSRSSSRSSRRCCRRGTTSRRCATTCTRGDDGSLRGSEASEEWSPDKNSEPHQNHHHSRPPATTPIGFHQFTTPLRGANMTRFSTAFLALSALAAARMAAAVNPDSGIVINWKELDKIVTNYTPVPQTQWLPAPVHQQRSTSLASALAHCRIISPPRRAQANTQLHGGTC